MSWSLRLPIDVMVAVAALVVFALSAFTATPAAAHPHVWVKASTVVIYDAEGKVAAIRHQWDFDEGYSAFAVQGLDKNKDGKLTRVELAELAKINTESLAEFDYFTKLKIDGKKQIFGDPTDYWLDYENATLTLNFTLPLKTPIKSSRAVGLEIYDPTYFVAFSFADGATPVTASRSDCTTSVTRAKSPDAGPSQNFGESFFSSLSTNADFGAQFSNKAVITCP